MKKYFTIAAAFISFFVISVVAFAQDSSQQENGVTINNETKTITAQRGQTISYAELAGTTNIDSSRDEQGNPVKLDADKTYKIASFTRTTISITTEDPSDKRVITLDLKPHKNDADTPATK